LELLAQVSVLLGVIGIAIVVYGVVCSLVRFVVSELKALRGEDVMSQRAHLRGLLGYYLLLGLEFLIAADIVESIISPEKEELINLAVVVAIRTVISFSLNWELAETAKRSKWATTPRENPSLRAVRQPDCCSSA
jgi:uncharacterized membrane protein